MTEDDPTLDEIAAIAARIEAIEAEAKEVIDDLRARRDRLIVAYVAGRARSKTAAARAAGLSRQSVDLIARTARRVAERAAEHDPQS